MKKVSNLYNHNLRKHIPNLQFSQNSQSKEQIQRQKLPISKIMIYFDKQNEQEIKTRNYQKTERKMKIDY